MGDICSNVSSISAPNVHLKCFIACEPDGSAVCRCWETREEGGEMNAGLFCNDNS